MMMRRSGQFIFRAFMLLSMVVGLCLYNKYTSTEIPTKNIIRARHKFPYKTGLILTERIPEFQSATRRGQRCKTFKVAFNLSDVYSSGVLDHQFRTWHWNWIRDRIHNLWRHWLDARKNIDSEKYMANRRRQRILVIPGVLTCTPFAKPSFIRAGGPLGDLVQWADLIAAAHILGHEVVLMEDVRMAKENLNMLYSTNEYGPCGSDDKFDMIFADYGALLSFTSDLIKKIKCRLRVVDIFGTEPAFNSRRYSLRNKLPSSLGKLDINPKQTVTFFPHTPDNSFLGFAVPPIESNGTHKENIALLYGKEEGYFYGKKRFIRQVGKVFKVHATLTSTWFLGNYTINHGHLTGPEYLKIMEKAKVLIGVGMPLEGPGSLEALGRGTAFIQPKIQPPEAEKLFKGKPTSRVLTSQVPYLETFFGPPYVYTIDTSNEELVDAVLKNISKMQLEPLLPREYSMEGMLERLAVLFEKQDFCDPKAQIWPPVSEMKVTVSDIGDDCVDTCHNKGLVCEPAFFSQINDTNFQSNKMSCTKTSSSGDIYYPAFQPEDGHCITQSLPLLYSCAGKRSDLNRLCPCREYIKYQVALCKSCL